MIFKKVLLKRIVFYKNFDISYLFILVRGIGTVVEHPPRHPEV
jgi:hypothetical protein